MAAITGGVPPPHSLESRPWWAKLPFHFLLGCLWDLKVGGQAGAVGEVLPV
jgi:hypothetical protein